MAVKDKLNVIVVGHVDSGKSTTTGHLILKLGAIDPRLMEKYDKEAQEMGKPSFKFAWVMDNLAAERQRGITIVSNHYKFETEKREFTVIDAPGHRDFIKNMITGASQADCGIVVVPASGFEGAIAEGSTTKEHMLLAYTLGIKQIIFAINKMDDINWDKTKFANIKETMIHMASECKFKEPEKIPCIPYSGFKGDNLVERSTEMPWYTGPTIVEALDAFIVPHRPTDLPLRLPLQDIYKIGGIGTVPVGRIETGCLKPGMVIKFAPNMKEAECKSVEKHCSSVPLGEPGDNVGFNVKINVKDISKGHVASDLKNNPAKACKGFVATVVIMNSKNGCRQGYTPIVDIHTAHVACKMANLLDVKNKRTKTIDPNPSVLNNGDTGTVEFECSKTMCIEKFSEFAPLGRFAVRDMKTTIAVGVVKDVIHGTVVHTK